MVFVFVVLVSHPCFIVSLVLSFDFSDFTLCLTKNKSNHKEPRFNVFFSMFCFFLFISMLTPHNNLALSN